MIAKFFGRLAGAVLLLLAATLPAHAAPVYRLTQLADLDGPSGSVPRDINNLGQVVGYSQSNDTNPWRAVRWDPDGTIHDLDIVTGPDAATYYSFASGINDSGEISGYIDRDILDPSYFSTDAFRWTSGGSAENLGLAIATAINSGGTVVGYGESPGPPQQIAKLWAPPIFGAHDLGTLPDHNRSVALDINASSQVVGASFTSTSSSEPPTMSRAFLWTEADGMQDLGALPGHELSRAEGINAAGVVVGSSWESYANNTRVAYRWTAADGMVPLGPGARVATDINASGQIVGNGEFGAFLWTSTDGAQSLASLLGSAADGWNLTNAVAINDAGQIAVMATGPDFVSHALLLTVVPEPASGQLILFGVAAIGGLARQRRSLQRNILTEQN